MISSLLAFFSGIVQLSHSGAQISYSLSKQTAVEAIPHILLTLLFCVFNVLFGSGNVESPATIIITVLIATAFFYVTFIPILSISRKSIKRRLALLIIGLVSTLALVFFFHLGFSFNERANVLAIPFIMTFYFISGSFLLTVQNFKNDLNRLILIYRGGIILAVMTIIAISFTLHNKDAAYLTSINVFFVSFAIEFWLEKSKYALSLKESDDLPKIEDYGLTDTQLQVAYLFLEGLDVQEVATKLGKSSEAIYTHSKNIRRKTNTIDRTALVLKFGKSYQNKGGS